MRIHQNKSILQALIPLFHLARWFSASRPSQRTKGEGALAKEKRPKQEPGGWGERSGAQSAAVHRLPSGSSPALRWSSVTSRAPSGALPSVTVRETCRRRLERETGRSHRWKRASTHVSRSVTGGQGGSFAPSSDARPRLPFPLDASAVGTASLRTCSRAWPSGAALRAEARPRARQGRARSLLRAGGQGPREQGPPPSAPAAVFGRHALSRSQYRCELRTRHTADFGNYSGRAGVKETHESAFG